MNNTFYYHLQHESTHAEGMVDYLNEKVHKIPVKVQLSPITQGISRTLELVSPIEGEERGTDTNYYPL